MKFLQNLFSKNIYRKFSSIDDVLLESERGIDYHDLQNLLRGKRWYEANEETWQLMLKSVRRESQGWINSDSLRNFPCKDLQTIDRLWATSSNGHFGFSAQYKIRCEVGDLSEFRKKVGWNSYQDIKFDLSSSPKGELPICSQRKWFGGIWLGWSACVVEHITQRLNYCDISSNQ
jgi:GUN4-like